MNSKHQAYCLHCHKLVGRVRRYHDSAVGEYSKHREANHTNHHYLRILDGDRDTIRWEAALLTDNVSL